jgi:hypothetical protein
LRTYRVYYGVESSKPYAPGNYDEYNKKNISEKVVFDEVCICSDCINKAGSVNIQKYALELWFKGRSPQAGIKCCYRCQHVSESRFCNHYKEALPWWVKYFIDTDRIELPLDLGPVKHMIYCNNWKPLTSIDAKASGSLKSRFRMGLYLIKYYKKIRKDSKRFLFQDLFSLGKFLDEIHGFLDFNYPDSIFDRSYSYLFYNPYKDILESNIYKKYYDKRAKLKAWAKA